PSLAAAPKDQEERLRGNHIYWTRVVAIHEIFPGHHLQAVVAEQSASRIRREFGSSLLVEGGGLYSEELMFRHGFFPDQKTRLAELQMRLWRAARVVIDVGLQTGSMSPDEAVGVLIHEGGLTSETATSEGRRYLRSPAPPMSYLTGYPEIEKLRKDYQEKKGVSFFGRAFHDRLLKSGPIPPSLIRLGLLGPQENPFPTAASLLPPEIATAPRPGT